MDHDFVMLFA